jgi:hypothetical protein
MIVRKINLKLLENCCFCLKAKKKKKIIIGDKNFRKYRYCLAHKKPSQRFFSYSNQFYTRESTGSYYLISNYNMLTCDPLCLTWILAFPFIELRCVILHCFFLTKLHRCSWRNSPQQNATYLVKKN